MGIRTIAIHQSLHRPSLVLGAERDLVMGTAIISLMVGIGGTNLISTVTALSFWFVSVFILRKMAKHDSCYSQIFLRHIKQQTFYPSRSSVWRKMEGYKVK